MSIDWDELFGTGETRRTGGEPPQMPRLGRGWIVALAALFVLFATGWAVDALTGYWWFTSLEQQATFVTRLLVPAALFVATWVVSALWLGVNWLYAVRQVSELPTWPGQEAPIVAGDGARRIALGGALVVSAALSLGAAGAWPTVMLALNRQDFGVADPLLGRDAGFYVFTVPLLELVQGIAAALIVLAAIGAAVVYGAGGLVRLRERQVELPEAARMHLALLAAVWLLAWAAGQYLARYGLLHVWRAAASFSGPGYVDVHARLPGFAVLALAAVVAAVLVVLAARSRRWLLAGAGLAAVVTLRIVLIDVYPGFLQRFRVVPNELERERTYIGHNIMATLRAHGLDTVVEAEYDPRQRLTAQMLEDSAATFANVRLWDWRVIKRNFQQQQEFRPQYEFIDVDIDRYQLAGGPTARQVELSGRELVVDQIQNDTWVNRHLAFTHGYGAVVAPVDQADAQGQPVLWMRDIPPETQPPFEIELTEPRIYFGEAPTADYAIVGTTQPEFDYPTGAENAVTTYTGDDGVPVGSFLRRLVFATRFRDSEILLSDSITQVSRIQLHREVPDRLRQLAPFLRFDPDPYLVITDEGRLVWLIDAYTGTGLFPYSRPLQQTGATGATLSGLNYVRNSVKVAVDAYDGRPRFYVVDDSDPILAAWRSVFPDLFLDGDEMPEDLVRHWRFPEALFRAQVQIYARYHMRDPGTFYNAEDLWDVPFELLTQGERIQMEPYYVTIELRGETEPEFVLMLPFTPAGRTNMIAWMAARCDPGHYGELVLYKFPKGAFVIGPEQVESIVDQDPEISQQLTLLGQEGSRTTRGNLLVIPVEDALVFVEPLYIEAERTQSLPEMKRVIVATGASDGQLADERRIEIFMRPSLREALRAAVRGAPTVAGGTAADDVDDGEVDEARLDVADVVRRLRQRWDAAETARRSGEWSAFGEQMERFESALQLLERAAGLPTPPPADADAGGGAPATPAGTATAETGDTS